MAQIYSNAYITILASRADHAAHGFLAHCSEYEAPNSRIPFRVASKSFGSITARKYTSRSSSIKSDNPLSTRAWALQEQMMANRILAYNKHTLEWRCASSMMGLNNSLSLNPSYDPIPKLISQLSEDPEEALLEWLRIVQEYSHRKLSFQEDKLPAIGALAERFAAVLGPYHAGIWQYEFIGQLCWCSYFLQPECRSDKYIAPSWSWAAANAIRWCETHSRDSGYENCCSFESVKVYCGHLRVYGKVDDASIRIHGKVIIASITTIPGRDMWRDDPMCTLFHTNSGVTELPLQRFYRTYFDQATRLAAPSRSSTARAGFSWDYGGFRSNPSIVREFSLPLNLSVKPL